MVKAFYILLFFLVGCQSKDRFSIQGHLPDKTYDGEFMYLVPLENAVKEKVDSAVIQDGKFRMEGVSKSAEIYILRAKPILRLELQEMVVVKEPGELNVLIGNNSLVTGTALNDSLQRWKEKKLMADNINEGLRQKFKMANPTQQTQIKHTADSLNHRMVDFHYNFVRNNKDNVVGKFVYQIMGSTFSPEQKMSLNMEGKK